MLLNKINFSLLIFSLPILIFCGRGLKGRAGCRQTEVQTDQKPPGGGERQFRCLLHSGARPTALLCPRNYGRGLVIYA